MQPSKTQLNKAQRVLAAYDVPCWLMFSSEGSDRYFERIVAAGTQVPAIAVLTPDACTVLVHALDADNIRTRGRASIETYPNRAGLWDKMGQVLKDLRYPAIVALNYSTADDPQVDVLGHGTFHRLSYEIRSLYKKGRRKVQLCSADKLLYAFSDRKSVGDIAKMRVAARRAQELIESVFSELRSGMTEREAADIFHKLMRSKPAYFNTKGVISEYPAWGRETCPIVLSGRNLTKGGHTRAGAKVIAPGDTVYFDFGVQLEFRDGSRWSSDIQRMGYVMRRGETSIPNDVQRTFDALVNAVDLGVRSIRPGMKGYEVDAIVRDSIRSAGYGDYGHATGHAIGELAHNPGTILAPRGRPLSHLSIQLGGVYTIEPRIAIDNGGSIEEMVLVTDTGGKTLCPPQKQFFIIN